jgi:hypothetical protein
VKNEERNLRFEMFLFVQVNSARQQRDAIQKHAGHSHESRRSRRYHVYPGLISPRAQFDV